MVSSTIVNQDKCTRSVVIIVPIIGSRIKEAREMRGWSQRDLAEATGYTFQKISKWEREAHEPNSKALIAIAKALGCTADFLLGLVNDPKQYHSNLKLAPDEINLLRLYHARRIPRVIKALLGDPDYLSGMIDDNSSDSLTSSSEERSDG